MSRIGKMPVKLPNGVKATINGNQVQIEGPGGKLGTTLGNGVSVSQAEGALIVAVAKGEDRRQEKQLRANFGTARAKLNNMVLGVTKGWKRGLELNGVGFTATLNGQVLVLAAGYSHEVKITLPKEIKAVVGKTSIDLQSADRELLGTYAAKIRKVRKPEPYLGKGIKYSEEVVRRKAGKAGKK